MPAPFWQLLVLGIGAIEFLRARKGWVEPWRGLFRLREEYKPGAPARRCGSDVLLSTPLMHINAC